MHADKVKSKGQSTGLKVFSALFCVNRRLTAVSPHSSLKRLPPSAPATALRTRLVIRSGARQGNNASLIPQLLADFNKWSENVYKLNLTPNNPSLQVCNPDPT